jgi:arginase
LNDEIVTRRDRGRHLQLTKERAFMKRRDFLSAITISGALAVTRNPLSSSDSPPATEDAQSSVIKRPIVIVEAPFNLGLRPPSPGKQPGVRRLAQVLSEDGLPKAVGTVATVRVDPPPYEYLTMAGDGVRNAKAIYAYSLELSKSVGKVLDAGQFPLVLGGDCSILLGNLLALRRRGRFGLVYLDAHSDTDLPAADHATSGAGSDVAVATGHGLSMLADIDGKKPLVRAEDTVLLGCLEYLEIKEAPITTIPLNQLRHEGIKPAIARVGKLFRDHHVQGFWIHLDADVLDDQLMPAVDSRHLDGMSWKELEMVLHGLLSLGLATGMEVTIYDPDLDPSGEMGRRFADTIAKSFRTN